MSGGSMGYVYSKVEAIDFQLSSPLRRAFQAHLGLVAAALHDIEWVDSGDYGPGGEDEAIRACLAPGAELVQAIAEAEKVRAQLVDAIKHAEART